MMVREFFNEAINNGAILIIYEKKNLLGIKAKKLKVSEY